MEKSNFAYIINLKEINDNRGSLVAVESIKTIPIEIKRIFYLYNIDKNDSRANHANCDTKMIIICLKGKLNILIDNGYEKLEYELSKPDNALFIDRLTWKKLYNFSDDCIVLVLCDTYYDKNDYINNYEEFIKEVNKS